jgi:DNA-binding CsgD family transcriptional regulator/tetratricopeptide (TPR) repeat protein
MSPSNSNETPVMTSWPTVAGRIATMKRRAPTLVERDAVCAQLQDAVKQAGHGEGAAVLIGGEAGVGKTSLLVWLEAMMQAESNASGNPRVFWGACEALQTPRPLGPLHDMAHDLGGSLSLLLAAGAPMATVFDALNDVLRTTLAPTVLLFEDVHWADQGTLDLIRFLGRRVGRQRTLLVLSFRDDEVGADHPLRTVIGDLPTQSTIRIHLSPLSRAGVAELAANKGLDEAQLHSITGGNPLFVTEVLANWDAAHDLRLPNTIRDAVLARTQRLPAALRAVLDLASVAPGKIERALIAKLLGDDAESAIEDCLARGLLVQVDSTDAAASNAGSALMFRHELARLATEATLSVAAKSSLHRRIIDAQIDRDGTSAARLVHHALELNDAPLVLALAPRAAHEAAKLGAHREAAAHFAAALKAAQLAPDEVRAQLNESWSYEAGLVKIDDETIAARHRAIALWRKLGNDEKVGLNLRWLSRLVWYRGDGAEAERLLEEALTVLRNVPPCSEQAWACSVRSQMHMINNATDAAVSWGEKALQLANELNVPEVRVHALNNIGTALLLSGRPGGLERMEESLSEALAGGFHEQAARVYTNVAYYGERFRDFAVAEKYAREGLEFDRRHDLDSWTHYLEGSYALLQLLQGKFEDAEAIARKALAALHLTTVMRLPALGVLAQVRMRQGHADGLTMLEEGLAMALPTRELQRIAPFALSLAEYAWLQGDVDGIGRALASLDGLTGRDANCWDRGDCAIWRHRAGEDLRAVADTMAPPYAAEMHGDIDAAAQCWRDIGDPYSAALALAQSPSAGAQAHWSQAIEIFTALGAEPAAKKLRNDARAHGVRGIRRGQYASARANQFGLTQKELDVLRLLVAGKTNQEISAQLVRSTKTIEHHVSAVLGKLGARNRAEAAGIAMRERLFADNQT